MFIIQPVIPLFIIAIKLIMQDGALLKALQMSTLPNNQHLQQANQFFQQSALHPMFLQSLQSIIHQQHLSINIRQAAAVVLKNTISSRYGALQQKDRIRRQQKQRLKEGVIGGLQKLVSQPIMVNIFTQIIYTIIKLDYPERWPNLIQQIQKKLTSPSLESVLAGLLVVKQFAKLFQYQPQENKQPLFHLSQGLLRMLYGLATSLMQTYSREKGQALYLILKIFWKIVNIDLPDCLKKDIQNLTRWIILLRAICQCPTPPQQASQAPSYFWKFKKWGLKIIVRFFNRYCTNQLVVKSATQVTSQLRRNFFPGFLKIAIDIISVQNPIKIVLLAVKILIFCFSDNQLTGLIIDNIQPFIFPKLISMTFLTQQDFHLFNSDQVEWIRRDQDLGSNQLRTIAIDALNLAVKHRNSSGQHLLIRLLEQAIQVLNDNSSNVQLTQSMLLLIYKLKNRILLSKELGGKVQGLLISLVMPLLSHPSPFLKARAVDIIAIYSNTELSRSAKSQLAQGVFLILSQSSVALCYKACLCISSMLNWSQCVQLIKPNFSKILQLYFQMANKFNSEGLMKSIQLLMTNFQDDLNPFSDRLCMNLATLLVKYIEQEQANQQQQAETSVSIDFDHSSSVAECLSNMKNILSANLTQQKLIAIVPIVLEVFGIISAKSQGCLQQIVTVLTVLLFKLDKLDVRLLIYFQIICGINTSLFADPISVADNHKLALINQFSAKFDFDTCQAQIGCLRQFVAKLGPQLWTLQDALGRSYMQLLFSYLNFVDKIAIQKKQHLTFIKESVMHLTLLQRCPDQRLTPLIRKFAQQHLPFKNGSLNFLIFYSMLWLIKMGFMPETPLASVLNQIQGLISVIPDGVPLKPLIECVNIMSSKGASLLIKKIIQRAQDDSIQQENQNTVALLDKYAKQQEDEFEDAEYDCKAQYGYLYTSVLQEDQEALLLYRLLESQSRQKMQEISKFLSRQQLQQFRRLLPAS